MIKDNKLSKIGFFFLFPRLLEDAHVNSQSPFPVCFENIKLGYFFN